MLEQPPSMEGLTERVHGLEKDVTELGRKFDNGLSAMRSDFSQAIAGINHKLDARSDNRWIWGPMVGFGAFLLSIVGGLGTLGLNPIRDGVQQSRSEIAETSKTLNQFMLTSADRFVNSNTFEGFASRSAASTQGIRTELSGLHEKFVGWREHDRLLLELRDAKTKYLQRDVFDTRTHDIDRRVDGFVRRLERLEGETFKGR